MVAVGDTPCDPQELQARAEPLRAHTRLCIIQSCSVRACAPCDQKRAGQESQPKALTVQMVCLIQARKTLQPLVPSAASLSAGPPEPTAHHRG